MDSEKIFIRTPRLILRDHEPSDLTALHAILHDKAVTWWLQGMYRETVEDTDGYLRSVLHDQTASPRMRYNLCVANADNQCIGEVGLHFIDGTMDDGSWGLGYYLRREDWGFGYMTEAVEAALPLIFARGARRVSASCLADNFASRSVLWRCGFTREGLLKEHTWHDGEWKDCIVLRLLREEWADAREKDLNG